MREPLAEVCRCLRYGIMFCEKGHRELHRLPSSTLKAPEADLRHMRSMASMSRTDSLSPFSAAWKRLATRLCTGLQLAMGVTRRAICARRHSPDWSPQLSRQHHVAAPGPTLASVTFCYGKHVAATGVTRDEKHCTINVNLLTVETIK